MGTKTAQHTPTPYKLFTDGTEIRTSDGVMPIASISREPQRTEREANGPFILRACNAHDDLLKACKTVVAFHAASYLPNDVYDLLLTAIAKAEGE